MLLLLEGNPNLVVDTTTLGSRIVSLSVSLLRARCVRYRRILLGMRRQLPHLHRWQHVHLFFMLVESGGGWMVARVEGSSSASENHPPNDGFITQPTVLRTKILGTKDPMDLRAAD